MDPITYNELSDAEARALEERTPEAWLAYERLVEAFVDQPPGTAEE